MTLRKLKCRFDSYWEHPMVKILDGKKLSSELAQKLKKIIEKLKIKPKLVIIQVGDNARSMSYIKRKIIFAEKIGALVEHKKNPENISETTLIASIRRFNADKSAHGIIVQLPLPKHIDTRRVSETIDYEKDVDGFRGHFVPATARGILTLLDKYKVKISGQKVVVVGRSEFVGKPIALALLNREATVTICHKRTRDLAREIKDADILVIAAGHPKLIKSGHVNKNQVIIDVGINILKDRKVTGDVDFKNVSKVVKAISPVPGGVGPMTIASLFQNLLEAYSLQA